MGDVRHLVAVPGIDSDLLTLDEAAAALRISRRTLARLTAAGRLPVVRQGRRTLVHVEDLAAYVRVLRAR